MPFQRLNGSGQFERTNQPFHKLLKIQSTLCGWQTQRQGDHEVKINIEFREMKDLYNYGTLTSGALTTDETMSGLALSETALFVDYIYLEFRVEKQPVCTKKRDRCMSNPLVASCFTHMPQLLVAAL